MAIVIILIFACSLAVAGVPNLSNPNLQQISKQVYVMVGDLNRQTVENQGFNSNITFFITDSININMI